MLKSIKIWCDIGVLTCKDAELKFTEYGIMIESDEEELFIPYGALSLARGKKIQGKSKGIRLYKDRGDKDCI